MELGLTFGLSYNKSKAGDPGPAVNTKELFVELGVQTSYFVAKFFKLGGRFSGSYKESSSSLIVDDYTFWLYELDAVALSGFAWPFNRWLFGFVDIMLGVAVIEGIDPVGAAGTLVFGLVAGETGLKVRLGGNVLLKLCFKPTYLFGKVEVAGFNDRIKVDARLFRLIAEVGLSVFW